MDKPWSHIGPDPSDSTKDILYISYTDFSQTYAVVYLGDLAFLMPIKMESIIMAVTSRDGGATWSDPKEISPPRTIFEMGEGKKG